MSRAAWAEINLTALRHNLLRVRELASRSRVVAIVKANGYGHGIVRVARALDGTDAFGVASIDEALELRSAGISQPIVLLEGLFEAAELPLALEERLDVVVHNDAQLEMLERAVSTGAAQLRVWLKFNTGMHRLGFDDARAGEILQRVAACRIINTSWILMTHLARADERDQDATPRQLERFARIAPGAAHARSMANSAGILAWPQTHFDWVRPGLMLYGISPFTDCSAAQEKLQPVMTVHSQLISVNACKKGDAIGYGGTYVCTGDMPVGVVAFGYGDGYPRHAANGTPVLVNGQRVPLIGRVSMDMITVDLRSQPRARVGDPVVLWGQGLPVEDIARHAQTIPYELVCGITQRVRVVEV